MSSASRLKFPIDAVPEDFGTRLKAERIARGWSQERLAQEAALERATVIRLEAGLRRPVADTVFRLESALDLEAGTLVPAWPEWQPIGAPAYGPRSRDRRRELGLSVAEVARATGISAATLSRFERELGACRALCEFEIDEGMVEIRALTNDAYAHILGFADAEEHDRFCRQRD